MNKETENLKGKVLPCRAIRKSAYRSLEGLFGLCS